MLKKNTPDNDTTFALILHRVKRKLSTAQFQPQKLSVAAAAQQRVVFSSTATILPMKVEGARVGAAVSDDEEAVRAVAAKLLDQAELPIEIGLHGFLGGFSALIGTPVTV